VACKARHDERAADLRVFFSQSLMGAAVALQAQTCVGRPHHRQSGARRIVGPQHGARHRRRCGHELHRGPQVTKPFTVDVTGPYRGGTSESYTATVSSDKPRSVTFFLYSGSLSSRALGKRAVIADRAMPASSRASGPPKQ